MLDGRHYGLQINGAVIERLRSDLQRLQSARWYEVETCGSAPISAKAAEPPAVKANVYPVHLAWSDNSDDESHFVIERCDQMSFAPQGGKTAARCAGVWRLIATVGADTASYVDNTASLNQTYIYRVKAINSKGSSGYTQEAVITTPPR